MALYNSIALLIEIIVLFFEILFYICESCICETYKLFAKRKNVAGEIVLVTGAGHGIGKELAIGYALLGATVICLDINDENNQQTWNKIKEMGKHAVYAYRCDVTNREEVFRIAGKIKREVGDVSILINNAGVGFVKTLLNYTSENVEQTLGVNLKGHIWTLQAFLPSMIEKNYGHVVAVSSLLAILTSQYATVYSATKAGERVLMRSLYEELRVLSEGKSLIKLTTVFPTVVLTGLIKKPIMRFPRIVNPLSAKKAASLIIDAQRRNSIESSTPSYFLPLLIIISFLPNKAQGRIKDFIGLSAESDN